jgi:hypothetical protein
MRTIVGLCLFVSAVAGCTFPETKMEPVYPAAQEVPATTNSRDAAEKKPTQQKG